MKQHFVQRIKYTLSMAKFSGVPREYLGYFRKVRDGGPDE
jgi:hypothetical protein